MTFLEFFIYSTVSNIIYTVLVVGFTYLRGKYLQQKLEKLVKSGDIKILSLDDLEDQITSGDKKTWN